MSPFDDDLIMNRLFDRLDQMEAKIDLKADNILSKVERKEKIFYITLGLVGGIVSIIQVVSSGIIG